MGPECSSQQGLVLGCSGSKQQQELIADPLHKPDMTYSLQGTQTQPFSVTCIYCAGIQAVL